MRVERRKAPPVGLRLCGWYARKRHVRGRAAQRQAQHCERYFARRPRPFGPDSARRPPGAGRQGPGVAGVAPLGGGSREGRNGGACGYRKNGRGPTSATPYPLRPNRRRGKATDRRARASHWPKYWPSDKPLSRHAPSLVNPSSFEPRYFGGQVFGSSSARGIGSARPGASLPNRGPKDAAGRAYAGWAACRPRASPETLNTNPKQVAAITVSRNPKQRARNTVLDGTQRTCYYLRHRRCRPHASAQPKAERTCLIRQDSARPFPRRTPLEVPL